MKSYIENNQLIVNGAPIPICAYMTYFEERNRYQDFADAGYNLFSVNASFSDLPLNATTGFSPFEGIFDGKTPDYSDFDQKINQILEACPDALIFPRVRITMPRWWIAAHPRETVLCADGNRREALYSPTFRQDGSELLRQFIAHVQSSDYAEHIIGYQLSGGNTQEWFHYDLGRSLEDAAFANQSVAETISIFAKAAKEAVAHQLVIGTFYGYCMEVRNPLQGTHALTCLLDDPNIDFFCSPVSYVKNRPLGTDWGDMIPGESVKLHRKIHLLECDIRTCLSDYPNNCRPGCDPQNRYNGPLWKGPGTVEESIFALRKTFVRQLTHGNGFWWFDMWGGWYDHPALMAEMEEYRKIMDSPLPPYEGAEVAVFVDERYNGRYPLDNLQRNTRNAMGNTGIPFDCYLLCDWAQAKKYKAIVLPVPYQTEEILQLQALCQKEGIALLQLQEEPAADALRKFCTEAGVWCYCESGDVVYQGRGYLCIHAATAGEKTVRTKNETFTLQMKQYETVLIKQ